MIPQTKQLITALLLLGGIGAHLCGGGRIGMAQELGTVVQEIASIEGGVEAAVRPAPAPYQWR